MKVHWRLSALVLFCSICVTLSILYYRTQVHHASLSPFDLWLFSCQTSIRIENIPTVTEDERAAMLPRPQHPAIKISASELLEASTEQLRRQYGSKIVRTTLHCERQLRKLTLTTCRSTKAGRHTTYRARTMPHGGLKRPGLHITLPMKGGIMFCGPTRTTSDSSRPSSCVRRQRLLPCVGRLTTRFSAA